MKPSLTSLAGAALIFLVVFGAYEVWYTRVAKKSNTLSKLQSELAVKKETILRMDTARSILQQHSDPARNPTSYFVAQEDVASFISMLEGIAEDSGTTLEVVEVSVSNSTKPMPQLSFTLRIDGAFAPVMQTLGIMEHVPYAVAFSTLSIVKQENGAWHAEFRLLVGSTL